MSMSTTRRWRRCRWASLFVSLVYVGLTDGSPLRGPNRWENVSTSTHPSQTAVLLLGGGTALWSAAKAGGLERLIKQIASGSGIKAKHSQYQETALSVASPKGNEKTVRALIEVGANLNV
jgi:hypothetical protein